MECPKCHADMEKVYLHEVEVDRCTGCKGIWFDNLEREKLVPLIGSDCIDTGDPKIGANWNEVDRINCPVCENPMIRLVDPEQRHIWYESCKSCYGVFLDAGEFKDTKHHTLLDRVKDLFAPARL